MGLEWNEDFVGTGQSVERQHTERRPAIHEHVVKVGTVLSQCFSQYHFPTDDPG